MPTFQPEPVASTVDILPTCHFCGAGQLREIVSYRSLNRVTSDCKAWGPGGRFAVCGSCGFAQTMIDQAWRDEIARIYGRYTIYFQGAGAEQSVFDARTGQPSLRSDLILKRFLEHLPLSETGQLLDVGCGNGNFLRAFAKQRPSWSLDGSEWDDKYADQYRAIPSFRRLHTVALEDVTERYHVVSIIHCLEHVPNPSAILRKVHRLLQDDGLLLVQVPDCSANPFMLTVTDHCSHFSVETLSTLVAANGFEIVHAVNSWIPKELTLIARKNDRPSRLPAKVDAVHAERLESFVRWLAETATHARKTAKATHGQFGIFGTAIAGTWLHGEVQSLASFFVDEDPNRIGKTYLGLPIYAPAQVPSGASVYIGLPPTLANSVRDRLKPAAGSWVIPPAF